MFEFMSINEINILELNFNSRPKRENSSSMRFTQVPSNF